MDDDRGGPSMTTTPITMGRPGMAMAPGDHICAFYRGPAQRDEVLLPYLREGILAGDKVICVMDDPDVEQVTKPLSLEADVEASLSSGQLDLLTSDAAYIPDGTFCLDRMLDFWEAGVGSAVRRSGYTFVRAVGEMTWALRDLPGVEDLVRYEARLNRFLPRYPQVILCLYDLERFTDGQVLMELLRTHPKVLMSGQLLENPWYVEPEEFAVA
ncbi:MEDS domain-containing protein [Kineosporia sp. A_224]|uniref:MEDS domain-containing protein n=2 Tax=unclassified Kineosporia TaxID=2626061 RepID=UPI001E2E179D|nr:MEDS domain-containing protein [Kineosporia sp. A_224]